MFHFKLIPHLPFALCACLISGSLALPAAQANDSVLSDANISTAGLTVDWFTQVEVAAGGHLVDIQLTIDENATTTLFNISYGNHSEQISENDLDAFGKPFGIKGAEERANVRREIIEAELKARNQTSVEVKVEKVSLPRTTLYTVNSHGVTTALDATTGETLWVQAVGRRDFPTIGLGASTSFYESVDGKAVYQHGRVAVINGNYVYCLDARNGKVLWKQAAVWPPNAPPVVNDKFVFVPTTNGRLQAFPLDRKGVAPGNFVSVGVSTSRPLLTEKTVSWATDSGYYTVAPNWQVERMSPSFRVSASDAILSTGSYSNGMLFVTSKDGYIYAVNEIHGGLAWELTMGQQIFQSPVSMQDDLYIFTREKNLFKIAGESGRLSQGWNENGVSDITEYVGASQTKLYVLDSLKKLNVLDQATGQRANVIQSEPITLVCANTQSDRLYVGSKSGYIQCIREVGNEFPFYHTSDAGKKDQDAAEKDNPFRKEQPGKDPFKAGSDDDPFKTTPKKDSDADMDDPFKAGGDNDPFKTGGSGSKSDDDPFKTGGSDDKSDDDDDPFKSDDG